MSNHCSTQSPIVAATVQSPSSLPVQSPSSLPAASVQSPSSLPTVSVQSHSFLPAAVQSHSSLPAASVQSHSSLPAASVQSPSSLSAASVQSPSSLSAASHSSLPVAGQSPSTLPALSMQSHSLVTASMQPWQCNYSSSYTLQSPLSANPQDWSVVVRDLQDEVKSLKAPVKGLHTRLQSFHWIEQRLMDIESQQEGVHALPSTRDYGWDHDDMPNLGLDTPYSLPMSAPMQRPVTSFLMAQQTFQYPGPVNSTSPILNNCRPLACRALPSEEIDCSCLQDPDVVIQRYPNLKRESKAGELTTKLAREAYFVMMKCTVGGAGNLPAFPAQEMSELKRKIFSCFPTYWQNPADFEVLWTKCTKAACRGLRRAQLRNVVIPTPC